MVKEFLLSTLSPLCKELHMGEDEVIASDILSHRYCKFKGELNSDFSDADLLKKLHPTPALGGTPRMQALDFIRRHEPFERGWYGAPIGWLSKEEADFAVGIRSALIEKEEMHLFAGAGIVEGSLAEKEWEETENKMAAYLRLLL